MTKQLKGDVKPNNGMKKYFERSPGMRKWYHKEINKYLKETHERSFSRIQIYRVVNDLVDMNPNNAVIKEAFMHAYEKLKALQTA